MHDIISFRVVSNKFWSDEYKYYFKMYTMSKVIK